MDALSEVETWLETRWMGRLLPTLVASDYKSLSSIHSTSPQQRSAIIRLFEKPGHRLKIRLLLDELMSRPLELSHQMYAPRQQTTSPKNQLKSAANQSVGGNESESESDSESETSSTGSDETEDSDSEQPSGPSVTQSVVKSQQQMHPVIAASAAASAAASRSTSTRSSIQQQKPTIAQQQPQTTSQALSRRSSQQNAGPAPANPPPSIPKKVEAYQSPAIEPMVSSSAAAAASHAAGARGIQKGTTSSSSEDSSEDESTGAAARSKAAAASSKPLATTAAFATPQSSKPPALPSQSSSAATTAAASNAAARLAMQQRQTAATDPLLTMPVHRTDASSPRSAAAAHSSVGQVSSLKDRMAALAQAQNKEGGPSATGFSPQMMGLPQGGRSTGAAPQSQQSDDYKQRQAGMAAALSGKQLSPTNTASSSSSAAPSGTIGRSGGFAYGAAPSGFGSSAAGMRSGADVFPQQQHGGGGGAAMPHRQSIAQSPGAARALLENGELENEYEMPPVSSFTADSQRSGWLEKRSGPSGDEWERRYVILKDDCLFWCLSQSDEYPSGIVVLSEPGVSMSLVDESRVEIRTRKTNYAFRAPIEDDPSMDASQQQATQAATMQAWSSKMRVAKLLYTSGNAQSFSRRLSPQQLNDAQTAAQAARKQQQQASRAAAPSAAAAAAVPAAVLARPPSTKMSVAAQQHLDDQKLLDQQRQAELIAAQQSLETQQRELQRLHLEQQKVMDEQARNKTTKGASGVTVSSSTGSHSRAESSAFAPPPPADESTTPTGAQSHARQASSHQPAQALSMSANAASGPTSFASGGFSDSSSTPFDQLSPADQSRRLQEMLISGSMFQKFKHKRGKKRLIWCPPSMDRLVWGEEGRKNAKGFILISDIRGVTDGCQGSKQPQLAFTVVSTQRTLELEAPNAQQKDLWIRGLSMLLYLSQEEANDQQPNENNDQQQHEQQYQDGHDHQQQQQQYEQGD